MANKGPSFGLSAQIAGKIAGKRDPQAEADVTAWIQAVTGEKFPNAPYEDALRDGVILCKLANKLMPGSITKINTSGGQFKLMENINKFQECCKAYGVPEIDVFQTVDLWEKRNIAQVTQCIFALGRTCQIHPEWQGPTLGPKMSEENKRQFSDEQLRASEGIINLQYGSNKGASQAGQNFGNTRHM